MKIKDLTDVCVVLGTQVQCRVTQIIIFQSLLNVRDRKQGCHRTVEGCPQETIIFASCSFLKFSPQTAFVFPEEERTLGVNLLIL